MITVEEAKAIILKNVFPLTEKTSVDIQHALGYIIADDIYASMDLPPFNQSNVDGYAITENSSTASQWRVITEIKAGDNTEVILKEGEAARIYTGAMVPDGSEQIIMQECVSIQNNFISCDYTTLKSGEHIRLKGSQLKKGDLAMKKGTYINPSGLGFLAGLGINKITVYKKPRVSLLITGNELQPLGPPLEMGKVYESNSFSLNAAIINMGLTVTECSFIKDDKHALSVAVKKVLSYSDILIISGGISVGDYDYVNEVLTENHTQTLFYKVAQKPGKPLYFGKNKEILVFGLPGNPASAMTCFYEYVYPSLKLLQHQTQGFLPSTHIPSLSTITKKKGLAHFLRAKVDLNGVLLLEGQESYKLKSLTETNAFIYLPAEKETISSGEIVEVHLLPFV